MFGELKKHEGIDVEIFISKEDNSLKGIYIQDARMKKYFELYPEVVLMDATYKLINRRMPLFIMLVIDGNGESQIAALFIIRTENYDIVMKMFNTFKSVNKNYRDIQIILSDKNFADRRAYKESFPDAKLQLCIFHVLQAFGRAITKSKMNINNKQKNEVLNLFQHMVFAETEEEYMILYQKLVSLNLLLGLDYFEKNWLTENIRKQWAAYFTNNYQHFMNCTTNRLESINQKLKTVVTKYGSLHTFLKETIQCIQSLGVKRDQRTIRAI